MSNGFSVYPCGCGRIHMISWDLVEEACEKNMASFIFVRDAEG